MQLTQQQQQDLTEYRAESAKHLEKSNGFIFPSFEKIYGYKIIVEDETEILNEQLQRQLHDRCQWPKMG